MARDQNFFYQNPGDAIGSSLARAIFGDPQMALKQRQMIAEEALRQAQMREADAHGGLYRSQATGEDLKNDGRRRIQPSIDALYPPAAPQFTPDPADPAFGGTQPPAPLAPQNAHPLTGPASPDDAFRAGLGRFVGSLLQSQENPNIEQGVSSLASFLGGDEMARRGMVAGGHTPGDGFALTPQRADQIAATSADAKQRQAFGVADINHRSDIPVAQVRAGATTGAASIAAGSRERIATSKPGPAAKPDAAGKPPKPPRAVTPGAAKLIDQELVTQAASRGQNFSERAKDAFRARAMAAWQQNGNPAQAVRDVLDRDTAIRRKNAGAPAAGGGAPVPGARKAPDGHWYVQQGKHPDGSPAYFKVG